MNAKRHPRRPRRHLTVRKIPRHVSEALDRETTRRGVSLNQAVIDALAQGLGVAESGSVRANGLRHLAGTWSAEDLKEFDEALAAAEQIDEELWR